MLKAYRSTLTIPAYVRLSATGLVLLAVRRLQLAIGTGDEFLDDGGRQVATGAAGWGGVIAEPAELLRRGRAGEALQLSLDRRGSGRQPAMPLCEVRHPSNVVPPRQSRDLCGRDAALRVWFAQHQ